MARTEAPWKLVPQVRFQSSYSCFRRQFRLGRSESFQKMKISKSIKQYQVFTRA